MPELPPEFDPTIYRDTYADVRQLDDTKLANHYESVGRAEGRNASSIRSRSAFVDLLGTAGSVLEIGPFASPLRRGDNVKYFDVLTTEGLRERARRVGIDPARCPPIDFVSATGDLSVTNEQFDAVLSSHVVEHQPDLIRHLQDVARVLNPDGWYFLIVPDKRYCFDHFIAESSIAEIVGAHARGACEHDVLSIIEHRAMTTHNNPRRHWAGDHGEPMFRSDPAQLLEAADLFLRNRGKYIDVHAWQFSPDSFTEAMRVLFDLRLSSLRLLRLYPTRAGTHEFYRREGRKLRP